MPASKLKPQEMYERAVAAYRAFPGQHVPVAQQVGIAYRTARSLWEKGVKALDLPPISEVMANEQIVAKARRGQDPAERARAAADRAERKLEHAKAQAARAGVAVEATRPEVREAAVDDAIRTRADLAKLCAASRGLMLGEMSLIAGQLSAIHQASMYVNAELKRIMGDPKAGVLPDPWYDLERDGQGNVLKRRRYTVQDVVRLQEVSARSAARLVSGAYDALQMERLHLGLPTAIVGVESMTLEEAIREIETAGAELEQARERGLVLIEGGKKDIAINDAGG